MSFYEIIRKIRTVTSKTTTGIPIVTASSIGTHTVRITTKTGTSTISLIVASIVYPMLILPVGVATVDPSSIGTSQG